jgi:hypothetical protein
VVVVTGRMERGNAGLRAVHPRFHDVASQPPGAERRQGQATYVTKPFARNSARSASCSLTGTAWM